MRRQMGAEDVMRRMGDVVHQRLIVERIGGAVSHPISRTRMAYSSETFDYGSQVAHQLSLWLARLPEQGTLEVSHPASWVAALQARLRGGSPSDALRLGAPSLAGEDDDDALHRKPLPPFGSASK